MKDKKKMLIIIISILLVILGGILIIIYNINKSNKIKNENMEIISSSYQDLSINVSDYKPEDEVTSYVKDVDINLEYNFNNNSRNIRIQRLKIKEL